MGKGIRMSTAGAITGSVRNSPVSDSAARQGASGWIWPGLVLLLLGGQLVMGVVAVMLATADPAWRVVPHYHDRALEWDRVVAARSASERLGWTAEITPADSASVTGQRQFGVTLLDIDGHPVRGASVSVELWHHARPDELLTVPCRATGIPGQYEGVARLTRKGLWQVEIRAERGEERFEKSQVVDWRFAAKP
jgi:nitrogen fixation protein FixH